MIAKLPLVPFVIINLTRLTAGVYMKVRFKSKVTSGFSLLVALGLVFNASLWDQGTHKTTVALLSCKTQGFSFITKIHSPLFSIHPFKFQKNRLSANIL